jgi:hypothetical protein
LNIPYFLHFRHVPAFRCVDRFSAGLKSKERTMKPKRGEGQPLQGAVPDGYNAAAVAPIPAVISPAAAAKESESSRKLRSGSE